MQETSSGWTKLEPRFTCQFVENNKVIIDTVYIPKDISGQTEHLYHRVGDDVVLPCRAKSSSSSCSDVNWLYWTDPTASFITEIQVEDFEQRSVGTSRLSLSSNCSLLIRNITDEDAREYVCRVVNESDANVVLNTLSVSTDPPDVHPRGNGDITLRCSLNRYDKRIPCEQNSIIWMDERGSQLTGEGVGFEFRGKTNCVSVLTVKHQSGNNKTVTCRFIEDNKVKIDADCVLHFSDLPGLNLIIIGGAVMKVVLMFLGVVAALVYVYRRRTKGNEEQRTRTRRTTENDDEDAL
ncbi:hypothetical protein OJAV_G00230900 [Oryzias javanicus]|uniref:Ig-like domain-containing protein n=1 Tax=Oryzias javanicus TaxID=123683 RepID=A0A437BZM5_ORYJA|nr:hypothetical protein OJAV_G00230900 [Oryzias javanicus]